MDNLESDRLWLRPFTNDDLDFLNALHADREVARYIGHGKPRTKSENCDLLDNILKAYKNEGFGHLAVISKTSAKVLCRCGLSLVETESNPVGDSGPRWFWNRGSAPSGMNIVHRIEIGYTFARAHWGLGHATESAAVVRDFAFASLKYDALMAAIAPENAASINVATKLGFSYRGPIVAFGKPARQYQLDRSDWENLAAR